MIVDSHSKESHFSTSPELPDGKCLLSEQQILLDDVHIFYSGLYNLYMYFYFIIQYSIIQRHLLCGARTTLRARAYFEGRRGKWSEKEILKN